MFRQEALQHRNSVWKAKAILLPGIPLWCIVLSCFVFITFYRFHHFWQLYRRINVSAEVTTAPSNCYINQSTRVCSQIICEGRAEN